MKLTMTSRMYFYMKWKDERVIYNRNQFNKTLNTLKVTHSVETFRVYF